MKVWKMAKVNEKSVAEFLKHIRMTQQKVETELGKSIAKCCATIQREAQTEMRDTAVDASVSYYSHNKKIPHHPSIAGNPPAVDTGTLRRSITYTVDEKELVGYVGSVIKDPPYGAYLEYGTSRMKPRPWLKPATEKSLETIKRLLAGAVKVGLYD
jgi:HK97 gp10 family phage protein